MKLSKFLVTIVLFLAILIGLKKDINFKTRFYKEVYDTSFNFAYVNKLYRNMFGEPIPFFNDKVSTVFNEKITFDSITDYKDGAKLEVGPNYLVPSINEGIVIFVGDKEGYGKTVVTLDEAGIDTLYGNLSNINVNIYDYVKKGELVGEANNSLYIAFTKDGEKQNYEEYLK